MEILFEILFDLALEGSVEVSSNKRVSKWIHYPLIAVIVLFYAAVVGLLLWVGVSMLDESVLGGVLMLGIAVFVLIMSVLAFRKVYLSKKP